MPENNWDAALWLLAEARFLAEYFLIATGKIEPEYYTDMFNPLPWSSDTCWCFIEKGRIRPYKSCPIHGESVNA